MRNSKLLALLVLLVFVALVSLGTWQVKRLAWKAALIEQLTLRVEQAPVPLQEAIDRFHKDRNVEYLPVTVRGRFDHATEKHLYALDRRGHPGWHVYTLLETKGSDCASCPNRNRFVYINRGFVPYEMKSRNKRPGGQITGEVEIFGLIRIPREQKSFADAENQPLTNEWYWPSLKQMSGPSAGLAEGVVTQLAALFVDERRSATDSAKKYQWPRPGVTKIKLSNRHLGYVITWYGLALALLGVYGFFLKGNKRRSSGETK